jgi:hypothetical protein
MALDIACRDFHSQQLPLIIDDQVQFELIKLTHTGLPEAANAAITLCEQSRRLRHTLILLESMKLIPIHYLKRPKRLVRK